MIGDVTEKLLTFFVPQMEQFGLEEQPSRFGSFSTVNNEDVEGRLWAFDIGEDCLFTYHELAVKRPMKLTEFPDDYLCLSSMSDASAKLCPVESRYLQERNTVSFQQRGGIVNCWLNPGEEHRSYSLCMTPDFFDKIEGATDYEKEALVDHLSHCDTNGHSRQVARALESIGPAWATRAGGKLFCEAKVHEIVARSLEDALADDSEDDTARAAEERRLVHEAQRIIDERFAERLTLQSLASELYVGKTRLCEIFRAQTNTCVAEYLRARRMSEARLLLETTDLKASEIAHAVGYAHQSSFTDAFRKELGMSPSQWRERARIGVL